MMQPIHAYSGGMTSLIMVDGLLIYDWLAGWLVM